MFLHFQVYVFLGLLRFIVTEPEVLCTFKNTKRSTGKCVSLGKCDAALSNLQAGIFPEICPSNNKGKVKESLSSTAPVCCPTLPRVSSEWCEQYKEILKEPLTNAINSTEYTVKCENFVSPFISGGRNAAIREYPHQVALGYKDKSSTTVAWKCGGTLISDQYVLTAGHCVVSDNNSKSGPPKKVMLGDRVLSKTENKARVLVDVEEIIIHPEYKPPVVYNDIALIKMKSKVNLSRSILPACMPQPEDRLDKIKHVIITGFGQLGALESLSDTLQTVDLSTVNLKNCSNYFKDEANIKSRLPYGIARSQICAGDFVGIKDSCRGDSGGPMVVNKAEPCVYYVVGVTSFGSNFCGYQQPGVYTNVIRYLDWIEPIVWPIEISNVKIPEPKNHGDSLSFYIPKSKNPKPDAIPTTSKRPAPDHPILVMTGDASQEKTTTTTTTTSTTTIHTTAKPLNTLQTSWSATPMPITSTVAPSVSTTSFPITSNPNPTSYKTIKPFNASPFKSTPFLIPNNDPFYIPDITSGFMNLTELLENSGLKKYYVEKYSKNKDIKDMVQNALNTGW